MCRDDSYGIDDSKLVEKYRSLQRIVHPDKFSTKDSEQQEISRESAAFINDAYATLKSPLQRAKYLVRIACTYWSKSCRFYPKWTHWVLLVIVRFPSSCSWSYQCPCGCGTVVKRYIIVPFMIVIGYCRLQMNFVITNHNVTYLPFNERFLYT